MGECIFNYCKEIDRNKIEGYVENIKILCERFEELSHAEKGRLIGETIGKNGVEIFAGGAVLKGVAAFQGLRKANQICNFEAMCVSTANKEAIIASSMRHAAEREA